MLARKIPFDVHARQFIPRHVDLHTVVLLEKIQEMVEVFKSNIFDAKIVNDEAELDETPFVAPKPWHGGSFRVAFSDKAGSKKIVCKDAGLGKTQQPCANFEVYPTIVVSTQEVVFQDGFVWDIGNLDSTVFRIRHGCVQVEVLEVNGAEAGTFSG